MFNLLIDHILHTRDSRILGPRRLPAGNISQTMMCSHSAEDYAKEQEGGYAARANRRP